MKKLVLAASIFAASTASAFAADLAARPYTKAPPIVAAMYDWSGFYIGVNGGRLVPGCSASKLRVTGLI